MKKKTQELLDHLISEITDKSDLEQIQDQLFKRGVESLLKAELTAHLGYESHGRTPDPKTNTRNGSSNKTLKTQSGEVLIQVPRDREGTFDPITVRKHSKMSDQIDQSILLLYAKGMSTNDISDFVEHNYGVKYSKSAVSMITDQLKQDIQEWQNRPLDDMYAVVWVDGIHYKIREDGRVKSKACLIILGINMDGQQDILGMRIYETESASVWLDMLTDLRQRGVLDILFFCSDNLKGMNKALEGAFPKSVHQICIVHQIRNSLKHVSYKDRREIVKEIKKIYQADDQEMAQEAFDAFAKKWGAKYETVVKSWENNWDLLTIFLEYPQEIRKLIYTTNVIESFNASLRKYTKNKKVFPNDDAALKSIYLAALQIQPKWQRGRQGWAQIYQQLVMKFPDRIQH